MKKEARRVSARVWKKLFLMAMASMMVCLAASSVTAYRVMAQASAPGASGGQGQAGAVTASTGEAQPNAQSPGAPQAAASQKKESGPYLLSQWWSAVVAIIFLVVVLLLTLLVRGRGGINFFQSPDSSVSVSKVQVWMWTMTIIFSYVYLFLWHGPPEKFPDSLWELMGISAVSTGAARYIATVMGTPQEPPEATKQAMAKQNWLVSMLSDEGEPSMMRLQLLAWTLVTIFLFLMYLHRNQALWDVPTTLVILMGISHVGYLGDKTASVSQSK